MDSNDYIESDSDDMQHSSHAHPAEYDAESSEGRKKLQSDSEQEDDDSREDQDAGIEDVVSHEEQLEKQILKQAIAREKKRNPFQEEVMAEILQKLKDYQNAAKDKTGEDLVTLRIQEYVYNKLLVMTYASSEFRLVRSHYRLGSAYLKHDCAEQAIEHLSTAIYKNQKLFDELPRTILFQCSMQNLLGQCLIKKEEYYDAIEILRKSCEVAAKVQEQSDFLFAEQTGNKARILLAQCFCHHKQYDQAIEIIDQVLESTKSMSDGSEQYAFALVEKAKILSAKGDHAQAVVAQQQAINILIQANYPKPEQVAEMYEKLGQYFDKLGNPDSSLACVQKVKTLYQQIYSGEDKRVIKARRKIATSLLKNQRFKEAVNELLEIVELEEKVFGQSSLQTARTLKLLGTVYISMQMGDARSYLKRAMNIFISHGNKKQVQEIKEKLRILMNANTNHQDLKVLSEQDL